MNESASIWRFCLAALAVWRLTHMIVEEDGPWRAIARMRTKLNATAFGRLMHCFFCLSLWISLPLAVWLNGGWIGIAVHWLALSGAACLFQKVTEPSQPAAAAVERIRIESVEGEEELCAVVSKQTQ